MLSLTGYQVILSIHTLTLPPQEGKDSCGERHPAQNPAVLVDGSIHLASPYLRDVSYCSELHLIKVFLLWPDWACVPRNSNPLTQTVKAQIFQYSPLMINLSPGVQVYVIRHRSRETEKAILENKTFFVFSLGSCLNMLFQVDLDCIFPPVLAQHLTQPGFISNNRALAKPREEAALVNTCPKITVIIKRLVLKMKILPCLRGKKWEFQWV